MDNEKINILIGSDINYAPYYGVMLTSLFMNNRESQFDVYLMTDSTWPDRETKKFQKLTAQYNSCFFVYKVDENTVKDFPQTSHITLPAYYRLIASRVLPESVHKILYLDGDIIVNGNIRPLWNVDLDGKGWAAVTDCSYIEKDIYERLNYEASDSFLNAGVALYNYDYWREHAVSEKAFIFLADNHDKVLWMDQDVVNALLHADKITLPCIYNFQVLYLYRNFWLQYDHSFRSVILQNSHHPIIVHYNGRTKPWHYLYYGYPYLALWRKYERVSLWRCRVYFGLGRKWLRYIWKRIRGPQYALRIRNAECIEESFNLSQFCS